MTTNAINYLSYEENKRHNLELERQGLTSLDIAQQNANAQTRNAESNAINAQANVSKAQSSWAEIGVKAEQNRISEAYNVGWLTEQNRHNIASEQNEMNKALLSTLTGIFTAIPTTGW